MNKKTNEAKDAKRDKKAEAKARKEAKREAKERAKREAKEAKERVKREAEEAKREAKEAVGAEFYQGIVELAIMSPVDLAQMRKLEEYLCQAQDLRLVLVGGSVDEGSKIVVSAGKPIPLIDVLKEMPLVEQVVKKGKKIQITLKTE